MHCDVWPLYPLIHSSCFFPMRHYCVDVADRAGVKLKVTALLCLRSSGGGSQKGFLFTPVSCCLVERITEIITSGYFILTFKGHLWKHKQARVNFEFLGMLMLASWLRDELEREEKLICERHSLPYLGSFSGSRLKVDSADHFSPLV